MLEQIKDMQKEILEKNNRLFLVFILTDMFYVSVMFLVHMLPWGYVFGLSTMAGGIISGIIMSYLTTVRVVDGRESLASKLRYFPVRKKDIRAAQYGKLIWITVVQIGITIVPIMITCFLFCLKNSICAVLGTLFSMLFTGMLLIELNLMEFGRKS